MLFSNTKLQYTTESWIIIIIYVLWSHARVYRWRQVWNIMLRARLWSWVRVSPFLALFQFLSTSTERNEAAFSLLLEKYVSITYLHVATSKYIHQFVRSICYCWQRIYVDNVSNEITLPNKETVLTSILCMCVSFDRHNQLLSFFIHVYWPLVLPWLLLNSWLLQKSVWTFCNCSLECLSPW